MTRKIEVADYNPEWEKLFKAEGKKLKRILGKNCVAVHHIGGTSVKGLKSTPVIDIMPVVKDISLVDAQNEELEAIGYECKGEYGVPGSRLYIKGGDDHTYHIRIFEKSSKEEIEQRLAVRDYLRTHADAAKEYAELKTRLADEFAYDDDGYCNGKEAFMKSLEQKILRWKKHQEYVGQCMALGMCFGAAVGCAMGTAFSNTGIGMCYGVSIGMCLGIVVGYSKKE